MTIKYDIIPVNQLKTENRWDVAFNMELKALYEHDIKLKPIEEIANHITNGATPYGAQFYNKGVCFYKAGDVKKFNLDFYEHKHISKEQSDELKRSILKKNDIVFTIKGKVGDVAVFPDINKESNINQDNALVRLKSEYDPFYFAAIFNSKFGFNQVKAFATETINPFLGLGNLKKLKLPILDEDLVNDISDKVKLSMKLNLDSLTKIKDAQSLYRDKLGINLKNIKKEAFFPVNLSDFKDVDLWIPKYSYPLFVNTLEAIKEVWDIIPIGDIVSISKGDEVGSDNYNKYLDKKDDDIPFIRTSDLANYEVDQFPDFYIPKEIYEELNQDLNAQDILFTKDGRIGISAMITNVDEVIIASGISRLRVENELDLTPEYLFLALSIQETGLYPALRRTVIASTIPHLRETRIKEMEIPILDKKSIKQITTLVKESFLLKEERKKLINDVIRQIDEEIS